MAMARSRCALACQDGVEALGGTQGAVGLHAADALYGLPGALQGMSCFAPSQKGTAGRQDAREALADTIHAREPSRPTWSQLETGNSPTLIAL